MFSTAPGTASDPYPDPERNQYLQRMAAEHRTSGSVQVLPPPSWATELGFHSSCMNLTDPLVGMRASEGSSPDGERALLQLSRSETACGKQSHALLPGKGTEERRLGPEKSVSNGSEFGTWFEELCASNPATSTCKQPGCSVSPEDSLPPPPTAVFPLQGKEGRTEAVDPKTIEDPKVMIHRPFTAQHLSTQKGRLRPTGGRV